MRKRSEICHERKRAGGGELDKKRRYTLSLRRNTLCIVPRATGHSVVFGGDGGTHLSICPCVCPKIGLSAPPSAYGTKTPEAHRTMSYLGVYTGEHNRTERNRNIQSAVTLATSNHPRQPKSQPQPLSLRPPTHKRICGMQTLSTNRYTDAAYFTFCFLKATL